MKHCCDQMRDYCDDPRVQVFFWPVFREYYIALRGNQAKQIIKYCPWCGFKLPKSVRDNYYDLLSDDQLDNPPDDFLGEEWWRVRGL